MINVSGTETLQRKSRSSRTSGRDAVNPGCMDFTGKDVLMQVEAFIREIYFLENAAVFFLHYFSNYHRNMLISEQRKLTLFNFVQCWEFCQEVFVPVSFLGISKEEDSTSNPMGNKYHMGGLHLLLVGKDHAWIYLSSSKKD